MDTVPDGSQGIYYTSTIIAVDEFSFCVLYLEHQNLNQTL